MSFLSLCLFLVGESTFKTVISHRPLSTDVDLWFCSCIHVIVGISGLHLPILLPLFLKNPAVKPPGVLNFRSKGCFPLLVSRKKFRISKQLSVSHSEGLKYGGASSSYFKGEYQLSSVCIHGKSPVSGFSLNLVFVNI
jgi:hypothetical protein